MVDKTTDRRPRVDWRGLALDLEAARVSRGVSLRTAATQMGVSVSALTKLRHGERRLSADGVARLVVWLYPQHTPEWIIKETAQ